MKKYAIYLFSLSLFTSILSCGDADKNKKDETATAETITKPNIIFILADDLGYGDLSVNGQKHFKTPNIDQLAAKGLLFTQHYSGSTVCGPSRSSLMTGQHTGHTFVRDNKNVGPGKDYPVPEDTYTIAESMKKAGYTTGVFGKWGLGFPGSSGDATKQGFDVFYGFTSHKYAHNYYPDHLWSNVDSISFKGNTNGNDEVYAPKVIHDKTLDFIKENKDGPFFAYVASIIPHAELSAPEEYLEKYRGQFLPDPPYEGVDEGPDFNKGPYRSQKEPHVAFAAMINLLDDQVGEIIALIEELGIADNTIVVFTSDNGSHLEGGADPEYFDSNGPFKGHKRDLYEGGIRTPMIVKWPAKIKPNTKTDHISAFWDVMPTLNEIVGVDTPDNVDGISFLPTLLDNNADQKEHEYLYWEFYQKGGRTAVRMGDWKGIKLNIKDNPDVKMELYDLSKDIGEENNIAGQHPEVIKELEVIFKEAHTPSEVFSYR